MTKSPKILGPKGEIQRIQDLFAPQIFSSTLGTVVGLVVGYVFFRWNQSIATIFSSIILIPGLARVGITIWFNKTKANLSKEKALLIEKLFALAVFLQMTAWAYLVIKVEMISPFSYYNFLATIFGVGLVIAGMSNTPASKITSFGFMFGSVVPYTVFQFTIINQKGWAFSVGCLLFILYLVKMIMGSYAKTVEIIMANEELEGLVKSLMEKINLEDELKKQKAISTQSAKLAALGEMAGGIAHEINNPLAILYGKVTQLEKRFSQDDLDSEKLAEGLEKLRVTTERIDKVVKGLMAFSRESSTQKMEPFLVSMAVEDTLSFVTEKLKSNGVRLELDIEAGIKAFGNKSSVEQVLLNLINNSFYAIKDQEEPWIRIIGRGQECEEGIKISVIDSGGGIDKEAREKIFNPFYTSKPVGKGTGLGLSISKTLIEDQEGSLKYEEESNNTQFDICLKSA